MAWCHSLVSRPLPLCYLPLPLLNWNAVINMFTEATCQQENSSLWPILFGFVISCVHTTVQISVIKTLGYLYRAWCQLHYNHFYVTEPIRFSRWVLSDSATRLPCGSWQLGRGSSASIKTGVTTTARCWNWARPPSTRSCSTTAPTATISSQRTSRSVVLQICRYWHHTLDAKYPFPQVMYVFLFLPSEPRLRPARAACQRRRCSGAMDRWVDIRSQVCDLALHPDVPGKARLVLSSLVWHVKAFSLDPNHIREWPEKWNCRKAFARQ